jgi:hypothetical protein
MYIYIYMCAYTTIYISMSIPFLFLFNIYVSVKLFLIHTGIVWHLSMYCWVYIWRVKIIILDICLLCSHLNNEINWRLSWFYWKQYLKATFAWNSFCVSNKALNWLVEVWRVLPLKSMSLELVLWLKQESACLAWANLCTTSTTKNQYYGLTFKCYSGI